MNLDEDVRAADRACLARLLPKVLEDGHVDDSEREQLLAVFRRGLLTTIDVREVFGQFLKGLASDVLADGVVTPAEREQCRTAVRELRIPLSFLSPELTSIIESDP
jgi:hypothetical protein